MLNLILSLPQYRFTRHLFDIRRGSRFSRPFRNIFQRRRIKTVLGGLLAALTLFASVVSPSTSALAQINQTETITLAANTIQLATQQSVRFPVNEVRLTQSYSFFHGGIDLDGVTGDPIYPIMKGQVESVVYERFGLGKHIIVVHGSSIKSVYAHLSKIEVKVGDQVETGQVIGRMGATGRSFGDHLHLEVFDNNRHINPASILPLK